MALPINEPDSALKWYCLRAQSRREHIAAEQVRRLVGLSVVCPRMAVVRAVNGKGKKKFIEPVFPAYFFARFNYLLNWRQIAAIPGVTGVVRAGDTIPSLPETFMQEMTALYSEGKVRDIPEPVLSEGDVVKILEGCFRGQEGRVVDVQHGVNRVGLLLEFLGREVRIHVPVDELIRKD